MLKYKFYFLKWPYYHHQVTVDITNGLPCSLGSSSAVKNEKWCQAVGYKFDALVRPKASRKLGRTGIIWWRFWPLLRISFFVCVSLCLLLFICQLIPLSSIPRPYGFLPSHGAVLPGEKWISCDLATSLFPCWYLATSHHPFRYVRDVISAYLVVERMHRVNCSPIYPDLYQSIYSYTSHIKHTNIIDTE